MKNELISIIVPIYNVEQYLIRCVESILNQTYKDLEIILVNDGSSDNCPQICDEYAKRDERIKVIHKENGGLSDARNAALDVCKGSFILCIDSDDFMQLDTVELLYRTAQKNQCDISTVGYVNYYDKDIKISHTVNRELVLTAELALEDMLYQAHVTTSAWGKLYRKELFDGVRYPKGKICEDLDTTYKLFSRSNKVVINSSKKFYYQQRLDSIINSQFALKRMDALDFAKNQLMYIQQNYPSIVRAAQNRYFVEALFIITQIPINDPTFKKEQKLCAEVIKKYRRTIIFDKKSRLLYKLYALMSFLSCNNMVWLYNIKSYLQNNLERIK